MTVIILVLISALFFHGASLPRSAGSAGLSLSSAKSPLTDPQNTDVPKGKILEKLVSANNLNQSYALYLPSNYTPKLAWPILYAFDPGARGKIPVEHFKAAAEKYGWIVAGLNNSSNGPVQQSADAFAAVWDDTHRRFAVDDRRVYVTGLSGGARAATFLATRCDCVAGVIGSGAGFPVGLAPSSAMHFAYFATVGTEDFNFPEVRKLDDALSRAGIVHRTEVFSGRHDWPPANVATEAVEWMELQAMKTGRRPRDNELAESIWRKGIQQAQMLEESNQAYAGYLVYIWLKETFTGVREVSAAGKRADELRDSREVKNAIRDERQQITRQHEVESELYAAIAARQRKGQIADRPGENDQGFDSGVRLAATLARLQKLSSQTDDTGDRRVARRVLEGVFIGLFEQGFSQLQTQKHFDEAAETLKLATEVDSDRPGTFFYLAWAYAGRGDKKKSLQALKTAVEKGFTDLRAITDNSAFTLLRNDSEYQQLIARLKNSN